MSNPRKLNLSSLLPASTPTSVPMTDSATEDRSIVLELLAQAEANRRKYTSIPAALQGLRFEDLDSADGRGEVILALQAWSVNGGGIFLFGPQGTGKTTMAATAAWAALRFRPIQWASAPRVVVAAGGDFSDPARDEAMRALTSRVGLVLDDLGQEPANEQGRSLMRAAIDDRIQHGLPLLITSNFTPSELGARHSASLTSRLSGYCRAYRVLGRDRRLDP